MSLASGSIAITQNESTIIMIGLDAPGTTSSTTYAVYITTTAGTLSFPEGTNPGNIILDEIMV
jgi:hypothetical protein